MLASLVRKSSLALAVSIALSGCGGRSLDSEVVRWYDPDDEVGGEGGFIPSKGGASYASTKSPKGGATTTHGYTASGGAAWTGPKPVGGSSGAGGYKSKSTASGGYKSSSSAVGGYKSTSMGGKSSSSGSTTGGRAGANSSSGAAAGIYRGGAGGAPWTGIAGSTQAAAGASTCPSVTCHNFCPNGVMLNANGCYDCTCAPPPSQLAYDDSSLGSFSCPPQSLTFKTTVAKGTDSNQHNYWVFNYTWTCTALGSAQPITGTVQASILMDSASTLTSTSRTFYLNQTNSSGMPLLTIDQALLSGQPGVAAGVVPSSAETLLTIRHQGSYFIGGIYVRGTLTAGTQVTLAGPFDLAAPVN